MKYTWSCFKRASSSCFAFAASAACRSASACCSRSWMPSWCELAFSFEEMQKASQVKCLPKERYQHSLIIKVAAFLHPEQPYFASTFSLA
eukprot:1137107-Pelagomonas_calceolata.AAC.4